MKTSRLCLPTFVLALTLTACGSAKIKFSEPTSLASTSSAPTTPTATSALAANPVGTDLEIELPPGDAARGDLLFHGKVNGQFPCAACHSLTPHQTLVGPSLGEIATTAATRKEGYSAEKYIHESVVLPNAYTVEGFSQNIMPLTFGVQMSKQDLADLMTFLMTPK
jgi:cytochrome c2